MSGTTHIAIIGAGLIGLSCADELLRRGAAVSVIDKHKAPVRGTSFSNSGMIHPSQAQSWIASAQEPEGVYKLASRSTDLLTENIKRLGLRDMSRRPDGCLKLYPDEVSLARATQYYEAADVAFEISRGNCHFNGPALFFPNDRSGDARVYGEALALDLAERGTKFHLGENVAGLEKSSAGWAIKLSFDTIKADHVIIAAGTASPDLFALLSIQIPITPVIGHALNFARPEIDLPDVPIMDAVSHSALSVFGDVLRISGGLHMETPEELLEHWRNITPDIISALGPAISTWSAPRPVTPLGRPYIAKAADGLWINAGHAHMGWTLCAGSGELMAEMILSGQAAPEFGLP